MSKLQNNVPLYTIEAQYISALHAYKQEIKLKGLLGEFERFQNNVKNFYDSQISLHQAKHLGYHSKTKHIPVKYNFIRHFIDEGGVIVEKVHTEQNCVDMFTKLVTLEKL